MLQLCVLSFIFLNVFTLVFSKIDIKSNEGNAITTKTFAIWPNATVPFYVNPAHFDHEQTTAILTALSMFAFKTCIKFKPVMARPFPADEVLVFVNPDGMRRCQLDSKGHSAFNPHLVKLGYECLQSPQIDMMIMRALGFPFEHNRDTRDLYIDVMYENVEPGAIELFTKEDILPLELRFLPYDPNSVMHFNNREYSKNGHRTIIFKDSTVKQSRLGLTDIDLRKIEIVYGPECRTRDRQEKIDLCQSYPGVARRKREADSTADKVNVEKVDKSKLNADVDVEALSTKNMRVNPNITPPPENVTEDTITKTIKELGIDNEMQEIIEKVFKLSSLALKNAREKYCTNNNETLPAEKKAEDIKISRRKSDVLGIMQIIGDFAQDMVNEALQNLTKFCQVSDGIENYQRWRCMDTPNSRCIPYYRSTAFGPARHSTQHRPYVHQSTKQIGHGRGTPNIYAVREGDFAMEVTQSTNQTARRRRDIVSTTEKLAESKNPEQLTNIEQQTNLLGSAKNGNEKTTSEKKIEQSINEKIVPVLEKESKIKENINDKEKQTDGIKNEKAEADDIKAKPEEVKEILRMKTQLPGLNRNNYNRRSHGRHRDNRKKVKDYDKIDAKLAKQIRQKKRNSAKTSKRNPKHSTEKEITEIGEKIRSRVKSKKGSMYKQKKPTLEEEDIIEEKDVIEEKLSADEKYADEERHSSPRMKKRHKQQTPNIPVPSFLPKIVKLTKKNEDFYSERRWPDGNVYYMIQIDTTYDLADMRRRIEEVNDILKRKTCVKLIEIKPDTKDGYEDYIVIDNSPDYVTGRVGGKQNFGSIELFRGGQHRQHAAMMIMAMLGFYFEVSRHDRDKYIRVHMRHVRPDKLHHFELIRSDATLNVPYDYASATHPAWQFWRQVGRTGISTVATYKQQDPDGSIMKTLGQNEKLLSDIDIIKINSVYGIDCFKNNPRVNTIKKPETNKTISAKLVRKRKVRF